MRYIDLIERVKMIEEDTELVDCLYFGALCRLEGVRKDLSTLDDRQHLHRVIKPFLVSWGSSARVALRKDVNWKQFGDNLRSLEPEFGKLRTERFRTIEFTTPEIHDLVIKIYGRIDSVPHIGGATTISKTLHLLNPEIFVMWDKAIRDKYGKKNHRIRGTADGYFEFLREMKNQMREAFDDRHGKTGDSDREIEVETCSKFKNKTLARLLDEYNLTLVRKEYNMTVDRSR